MCLLYCCIVLSVYCIAFTPMLLATRGHSHGYDFEMTSSHDIYPGNNVIHCTLLSSPMKQWWLSRAHRELSRFLITVVLKYSRNFVNILLFFCLWSHILQEDVVKYPNSMSWVWYDDSPVTHLRICVFEATAPNSYKF